MANKFKGEASFEVEGKKYTIQYSHAALIILEEKLGRGLMKIMKEIESWSKDPENIKLGMVRDVLWAGLQKHHPGIDPEAVTEMIGDFDGGFVGALNVIGEAMGRAFRAPETKGTNPPQKANGTGTEAGSSTSASDTTPTHSGASHPAN